MKYKIPKKEALRYIPTKDWMLKGALAGFPREVFSEDVAEAIQIKGWSAWKINGRVTIYSPKQTGYYFEEVTE